MAALPEHPSDTSGGDGAVPPQESSPESSGPGHGERWATTAVWFGPEDRPLLGWLTEPTAGVGGIGVVIVAPLGYEYWTAHRALRTLAERLAAQGCAVLRFDLDGTGDSAGGSSDPDQLSSWRTSVRAAVDRIRAGGSTDVVLAGIRFGATLALLEGVATGADRIVAWAPIERGRGYVRELRLLGRPIPERAEGTGGGIAHAGSAFSPQTLTDLGAVDLASLDAAPAGRVLVVDREDRPPSGLLLGRLEALGTAVDHVTLPDTDLALDRPTEYAEVPEAVVGYISTWIGTPAPGTARHAPTIDVTASARIGGATESVVRLGTEGLIGIETEPDAPRRATVVWCNSGSEPHEGPGRAWVEYARDLAEAGYASVRLDFSGWGESPDLGHAPGRPYDAHCIDEIGSAVASLRSRGHERIIVAGLCAGAWITLRAALLYPVDGVIAFNPQLYWAPGDPVEADLVGETRVRRTEEIRRIKRWRRTGLWTALDAVGVRHPVATWIRELEESGTPILMLFAEGDDGIEFLEDRVGRAWGEVLRSGTIQSRVIPGIDHPMHRTWLRSTVVDEARRWLDALTGPDSVTPAPTTTA